MIDINKVIKKLEKTQVNMSILTKEKSEKVTLAI